LVDKLDEIIGVKSGADKEELECFFAYTGYTLFCKNNKMKKMAQFVDIESKSNNGKSTIEDLVKSLLTNTKQVPMYSSKSMAKIDEQKNQFTYAEMDGKIANFDDEGNKNVLSRDNVESIKKLLTPYPRVSIEHKGIDSATVYLPIKL
jgi:phage/plasmid-associated DNA primase